MSSRSPLWRTMLAVSLLPSLPQFARAQMAGQPAGRNVAQMKFAAVPGLPTCAPGALQSGDPTKGPSVILGKLAAGCSIPWHWHTPNEHLMVVSGVARVEAKDEKPLTLQAGGFALINAQTLTVIVVR